MSSGVLTLMRAMLRCRLTPGSTVVLSVLFSPSPVLGFSGFSEEFLSDQVQDLGAYVQLSQGITGGEDFCRSREHEASC